MQQSGIRGRYGLGTTDERERDLSDPRAALGSDEVRALLAHALTLSEVCRTTIAEVVAQGFSVERKPDRSLVTTADRAAEEAVRTRARILTPEAGVFGEEFGHDRPGADFTWVVDPVDGTAEFAAGLPVWGTIIGLWHQGLPVAGVIDHPVLDTRTHAAYGLGAYCNGRKLAVRDLPGGDFDGSERVGTPSRAAYVKYRDEGALFDALTRRHRNFRVFHTCLTHTAAANGGLDAALEWDAPLWDVGATRILVEEAGGCYRVVREREQAGVGTVYCAVFGRPRLVASIAQVLCG